jgi:hypothetical protein
VAVVLVVELHPTNHQAIPARDMVVMQDMVLLLAVLD